MGTRECEDLPFHDIYTAVFDEFSKRFVTTKHGIIRVISTVSMITGCMRYQISTGTRTC